MNDQNYMTAEPSNFFLIKCHLKENEIDPGPNAHYDPENNRLSYFFNQDDQENRNAQFYLSGNSLFLRWTSPSGHVIHFNFSKDEGDSKEKLEPKSRFFSFLNYSFRNFRPHNVISELKSYSSGEYWKSKKALLEGGYPTIQLTKITNLPPERRKGFEQFFQDKTILERDRYGKLKETGWEGIDQNLENMIGSSFDHFYHDRYEILPEESPQKKTKPKVLQQMQADLKGIINQEKGIDTDDLMYFFQILKRQMDELD
ncbi:MAG: hypothetical protein KAT77_06325 [Nanoarchaeota archaeon]|nr:hypothetical protein [Nanoarchaeota archaeon]